MWTSEVEGPVRHSRDYQACTQSLSSALINNARRSQARDAHLLYLVAACCLVDSGWFGFFTRNIFVSNSTHYVHVCGHRARVSNTHPATQQRARAPPVVRAGLSRPPPLASAGSASPIGGMHLLAVW